MSGSSSSADSQTHYDVLGIRQSATAGEIRKAWVARARECHPDLNTGPDSAGAEAAMREVNEAWHVLGDATRKRQYDADLITGTASARPTNDGAEYGGWKPYSASEDAVDPRLLSDAKVSGSRELSRAITLLPIAVFVTGVFMFFCGLLLASNGILALGGVMIAFAVGGFVLMPLLVMSRAERDPKL